MRPHLPPQLGLILLAFCTLATIARFAGAYATSIAQAESTSQVFDPLVTTNASDEAQVAFGDLIIGIQNSTPTYVNQAITFSATLNITDVTGLTFRWQFGDSQSANGRGVQHTYSSTGSYLVRLFVTSATEQKEAEKRIQVTTVPILPPAPPVGLAIDIIGDAPNQLEAQKPINFLASVAEGKDVLYTWNFGDGSPTVSGSAVTHAFAQPGSYTIQVTAVNSADTISERRTINVKDAPVTGLLFTYTPNPSTVGEFVTFTADQTRGTRLHYQWQFSDGSLPQTGRVIRHSFGKSGRYEVRVTAVNSAGEAEYSETITIRAAAPRIISVIEDSPKNPNEQVNFFVSVSSEAPINLRYEWGDRARITKTLSDATNALYRDENAHAYPEAGKYPVIITAYNEFGFDEEEVIVYIGTDNALQSSMRYEYTIPVLPKLETRFAIIEDVSTLNCRWVFTDQLAKAGTGRITIHQGKEVFHNFSRSGWHVVTIECRSEDATVIKIDDFILGVRYPMFVPMVNYDNLASGEENPRFPTTTATNTPVPPTAVAPTATPTLLPTLTPTATPPALPTATATFIATAPPTLTATPTAGEPFGGTIPQR